MNPFKNGRHGYDQGSRKREFTCILRNGVTTFRPIAAVPNDSLIAYLYCMNVAQIGLTPALRIQFSLLLDAAA